MITGELKTKIDKIWDDMYSYGIANPLVVIEQLTYLFFIRSLDDIETRSEKLDAKLGTQGERIFPEDKQHLRWSRFKNEKSEEIFRVIRDEVFPFIKKLNPVKKSSYAKYMRDANFMLPNALITEKVITSITELPLQEQDMKGDIYEYMISKIQTAGRIGQFRTPRHIIQMMVEMLDPKITDTIADPACGTGGFLVMAGHYVREHNKDILLKSKEAAKHYASKMFTGYDTDQTMLRISAMNTMLHGMDNAKIAFNDSLSKNNHDEDLYTVVLANPPFKGSLDHDAVAPSLSTMVNTKKTELLFLALFIRMLEAGGRCACIVPDGVMFGNSNAHTKIRKELIEKHKLNAVISMPAGVFRPYAGVSTAVLVFTKTGSGGTDNVWFYDMKSDGLSLDDKRTDLGTGGDIKDIVTRYKSLTIDPTREMTRSRCDQSFIVPKKEIVDAGYDLSLNRYKESDYIEQQYDHPSISIERFKDLEKEINAGIAKLEAMLK